MVSPGAVPPPQGRGSNPELPALLSLSPHELFPKEKKN